MTTVEEVHSSDGTPITVEITGRGAPLVLVCGGLSDRHARSCGMPLATALAPHFTVATYDRRGRGGSGDRPPYAIDREVEDLGAVIARLGGSAFVFGHSSGGILALHAALRLAHEQSASRRPDHHAALRVAIPRLAIYEPPLRVDDGRVHGVSELGAELARAAEEGRRGDAVTLFLTRALQLSTEAIEQRRASGAWPMLEALAPTLSYDARLSASGPALLAEASAVTCAVLLLRGDASPAWLREAADAVAGAIPHAKTVTMRGQAHAVEPAAMAAALVTFFA